MDKNYTFAELEKDGVESCATFDSKYRSAGCIMNGTDFVHYRNDTQLVRPVAESANMTIVDWSHHGTERTNLHAVIRFKRALSFPRYSMKAGERWGFVAFRKRVDHLKAIQAGERFDFAGGQCLAEDVEVIYIGQGHSEYSRAAGYI